MTEQWEITYLDPANPVGRPISAIPGWEPFSVDHGRIWLRRKIAHARPDHLAPRINPFSVEEQLSRQRRITELTDIIFPGEDHAA